MRYRLLTLLILFTFILGACSSLEIYTNTPPVPASLTPVPASQTPVPASPTSLPVDTPATQPPAESPDMLPKQFRSAQAYLAQDLGIPQSEVTLKSSEEVMWRDSCLGIPAPNEMCAQVITPGYRVIFSTPKGDIEVHTNESGSAFRVVSQSVQPSGETIPAIVWERSGGIAGICQILTIYQDGHYQVENCKNNTVLDTGKLSPTQLSQVNNLLKNYAQSQWESKPPAGSADMFVDSYTFYGNGSQKPGSDIQDKVDQLLSNVANLGSIQAQPSGAENSALSGIQGQVLIGPTCPGPVQAGSATQCADKPLQATFTVLNQSKQPVTQFETDAQGRFQVALPPGTYILQPETSNTLPRAAGQTVTVVKGQITDVQITFDSGIR